MRLKYEPSSEPIHISPTVLQYRRLHIPSTPGVSAFDSRVQFPDSGSRKREGARLADKVHMSVK